MRPTDLLWRRQRYIIQCDPVAPESSNIYEQNLNLQTLVTILNSTKATEIPNVVRSLSQDAQDTLMKYLYKGMALPGWGDVSGSVLLGWHEKVSSLCHLSPCSR